LNSNIEHGEKISKYLEYLKGYKWKKGIFIVPMIGQDNKMRKNKKLATVDY